MIFHDLFVIRSFPGSIEVLMPQSVTAGVSLEPFFDGFSPIQVP